MLGKIRRYQQLAQKLEPNSHQRESLLKTVDQYLNSFQNSLGTSSTYHPDLPAGRNKEALCIKPFPENIESIIETIQNDIIVPGLNIASPGFLGFIPGSGLYAAALGDYIAATTNRFVGFRFTAPGATRLETELIQWLCGLVGYTKYAGGNLSSGGSLANFIAIVAAREHFNIPSQDYYRLVIYLTSQTHHSVIKALRIAGLSDAYLHFIPVDDHFRMDPVALRQEIKIDKQKRLIPWLVVATLGTTNTGSVDPIAEIVDVASSYQLWVHADAAYGGCFILCKSIKKKLLAVAKADSITLDPHKGLFIPFGLGVVLTREKEHLKQAYLYDDVDYLPELHDTAYETSAASLSPELSRHFRGLRLWIPLKLYGVNIFSAALNEKILLARFFYNELLKLENIEIACKPELSIVTFRYCPTHGNANRFNTQLFELIKRRGRVFLSTTRLNQKVFLRMACLNFRTHLENIVLALEELQTAIRFLLKS